MKNIIIAFSFLFCIHFGTAQKVVFGEVTKEELSQRVFESDTSANAVILYKNQESYLLSTNGSEELITEIHQRIKIYNKRGFDYATEQIRLYKAGNVKESVTKLKAFTYNLEKGNIIKTPLDNEQIFENEVNYNYDEVKFTMPKVKEGSVIEFQYKLRSPFIWNIDEFVFQYDIPIKKLRAELRTPKGFIYKQTHKGSQTFSSVTSSKMDHRIGMDVEINVFNFEDVPALKQESYVDDINNYRMGVMFELVSLQLPGLFRSYAQSWSDVAKTIGQTEDYKNGLDKTNSFKNELDQILKENTDAVENMKLVFKYVKDNIKWDGMDGKYFRNGIRKALKEKKGNAADINLTLVAMLRYAGIEANPVVISTKDNLIPYFPTVDRLNYVIAYALIEEVPYFMDATEEFSDINTMPIRDYNWRGVLVDSEKKIWNLITIKEPEQSQKLYFLTAVLNVKGELKGSLKTRYTKHSAVQFRNSFKDQNLEMFLSTLESQLDGIEISNYEVKATDTHEGFVSESFDFNFENASELINDKIYLRPLSFQRIKTNPFVEDKREFPIDFGHPSKENYNVSIKIPDGYEVESMPKPTVIQMPNGLGEFKFLIDKIDKNIKLSVNFELKKAYVTADNFEFLKEFFNQIIIKEGEQIILKKS